VARERKTQQDSHANQSRKPVFLSTGLFICNEIQDDFTLEFLFSVTESSVLGIGIHAPST